MEAHAEESPSEKIPLLDQIGALARAERESRNLTIADMAKAMGVGTTVLGNFERGVAAPKGRKRRAIERELNWPRNVIDELQKARVPDKVLAALRMHLDLRAQGRRSPADPPTPDDLLGRAIAVLEELRTVLREEGAQPSEPPSDE